MSVLLCACVSVCGSLQPRMTVCVTLQPRVVVMGSGWGAHACMKVVDTDKFDVVAISPRPFFVFTPMLASSAVGTVVSYHPPYPRSPPPSLPPSVSRPLLRFIASSLPHTLPFDCDF